MPIELRNSDRLSPPQGFAHASIAPAGRIVHLAGQLGTDADGNFADGLAAVVFYSVPVAGADVPLVVVWLVTAAVWFTVSFRFVNLRGFRHAIDLVLGRVAWQGSEDPEHREVGEVSHFQALSTAVSGTVGIGNIGGVAVAPPHDRRLFAEVSRLIYRIRGEFYNEAAGRPLLTGIVVAHQTFGDMLRTGRPPEPTLPRDRARRRL